jgi:spermidine synthase
MKPRELIDTAIVPGGDETLRLFRRGDEFTITLGGNALMSSRTRGSEEALASVTCQRLRSAKPHLLVGGYGMGFTLRAALAALGSEARLTVAELVPQIIEWAKGPMAGLSAGCLDDPRVSVAIDDVAEVMRRARGTFDAILLDVDNGPHGLTLDLNHRLYSGPGLAAARAALGDGDLLAIWSATPDQAFTRRLATAGFEVEEVTVRASGGSKGARHHIWFGRRC